MDAHIEMSHYSSQDGRVRLAHASLRIRRSSEQQEVQAGDCFDPSTSCDEQERLLIEELRSYLRPECAPACLVERLQRMFDTLGQVESSDTRAQLPDRRTA
ncbi:hypothetical protein KIM372_11280 [Bombiscardovia nodaiensis]|uniref:Uncharacterized protein n=1 Tax=Bombiscardovia nodaiensis TaxID=2932181 RepID=A0ABM8B8V8_9BIFI|nr:hypothetical protein KIM372_11280 [Bombiscardovia nodaiensis]